jgi:hypothetical protein
MQFLVAKQPVRANIFGHLYDLTPVHTPGATLRDILVTDDGSAHELLAKHREILASATFDEDKANGFPKPLGNLEQIPSGSKVLILRCGGIGDHIMLTPALKALRERLPDRSIKIWLAVQKDMFMIFEGNPYIDRLYPLPVPMAELLEADYVVDFPASLDEALQPNSHLTDYWLKCLGLDPVSVHNKAPCILPHLLTSKRIIDSFSQLRRRHPQKLFVLLNWFASTHIKSLPPSIFSVLTKEFSDFVFLVAHPESLNSATEADLKEQQIKAINLSSQMETLYDYFTAVHLSDAVVCADTSTYHISSSYRKPSLVVIGPTYSILTKYYPNCLFVEAKYEGKTCTSPCGRTKGACPEAELLGTPYSPCLLSLSLNSIIDQFHQLIDICTGDNRSTG